MLMKEIQKLLKYYKAFYNSIYALLKIYIFWATADSNYSLTGKLYNFEKIIFIHKVHKTSAVPSQEKE